MSVFSPPLFSPLKPHYPVVIIGGGPAGSVAATRLAQQGIHALVLERDKFPRFHIGESLLPNGNRILKEIGVWDKIAAAGFIEKRGAQFTLADRSRTVRNVFAQGWLPGLEMTYQVERARFDEILLRHAQSVGAQVCEQTPVTSVRRIDNQWQIQAEYQGQPLTVTADWVIDASGRHCVMGRTMKLEKSPLPYPGRMAVFNHFEGMQRDTGEAAGDIIVMRLDDAWFWAIPISPKVTSVGVVLQKNSKRRISNRIGLQFFLRVFWARQLPVSRRCRQLYRPGIFLRRLSGSGIRLTRCGHHRQGVKVAGDGTVSPHLC
jgi:flavin-dependent dehydrogenase